MYPYERQYGGQGYAAGSEQLVSQPTGIPGLRDIPLIGSIFGDPGGKITWRPQDVGQSPWFREAALGQRRVSEEQEKALGYLRAAALGQAPSAAELQMKEAQDRALAQQVAFASSARGGAGAQMAAHRLAGQRTADITGDIARQSAILRAQEQERARGELVRGLGGYRAQEMAEMQAAMSEHARREAILAGLTGQVAGQAGQTHAENLAFMSTLATQLPMMFSSGNSTGAGGGDWAPSLGASRFYG